MSSVNHQFYSQEHFERIHYYAPTTPLIKPRKKEPNTNLKIGLIASERLYHGLRFEAEVFLLTEENWEDILTYTKLDFLLVESCMQTITGHWVFSQMEDTEEHKMLINLVSHVKKKKIPTVYWFTQDHIYHDNYKNFSSIFDCVFCADNEEITLLAKENIEANLLLPAVQPVLYNPLRDYKHYNNMEIGVLFDGWSDIYRFENKLEVLKNIKLYGLKIIDSKKEIFSNKLDDITIYKDDILGSVSKDTRQILLKYSKAVVSFEDTLQTKTMQQWDALEVAASRVNLLHRGEFEENDIRKHIAIDNKTDSDLLLMLECFVEDELYSERLAHKAWRVVNEEHTFNHRLIEICNKLNMKNIENSLNPKASLIAPTYRADFIFSVIQNYKKQSYNNKELILIYNGIDTIREEVLSEITKNQDIKLKRLPPEVSVGECLNFGNSLAKGKYTFRIDDDDYYGINYIQDMMIYLNGSEFDVFAKPPTYLYLEENKSLFKRKTTAKSNSIVDSSLLLDNSVTPSGNTFGGNRNFLLKHGYPMKSFLAADKAFILEEIHHTDKVLIMDSLNMVISRRADIKSHTWQASEASVVKNAKDMREVSIKDIFI